MTQKHYTAVKHWYPLLFGRFILLDFSLVFYPEMSVSQPFSEGSASYGSHWMSTGGLSQVQTTLQPPSPSSRTPPHRQRRLDRSHQIAHHLPSPHRTPYDPSTSIQPHLGSHHGRTQHRGRTSTTPWGLHPATHLRRLSGMSGLSYRHLKALPEDLHKSTYQMLCPYGQPSIYRISGNNAGLSHCPKRLNSVKK